jgi:hypothetical protein
MPRLPTSVPWSPGTAACLSRPPDTLYGPVLPGGTPLDEITPDPLPAELAPFVAQARARLEQATDGLEHDAAVEHLEAAVTRAAIEASRLGISFPAPDGPAEPLAIGDGDGSIVVVQRIAPPDPAG